MTIRPVLDTNVVLSGLLILARSNTSRERSLVEVRELTEVIAPPPLAEPVCRDPDDDAVLALGVAASVDLIVSGDQDLSGTLGAARTAQSDGAGCGSFLIPTS
jgi:predicted nucleic acid-binding protein